MQVLISRRSNKDCVSVAFRLRSPSHRGFILLDMWFSMSGDIGFVTSAMWFRWANAIEVLRQDGNHEAADFFVRLGLWNFNEHWCKLPPAVQVYRSELLVSQKNAYGCHRHLLLILLHSWHERTAEIQKRTAEIQKTRLKFRKPVSLEKMVI